MGLAPIDSLDESSMRKIRRLGCDGVDLQCDSDIQYMESFEADRFKRLLEETGLRLSCVSNVHDVERISSPSPSVRREAYRRAQWTLELAVSLEVTRVRLYFGCPDLSALFYRHSEQVAWEGIVRETATRALPILQRARDLGLRVVIEPHPRQSFFTLDDLDVFSEILASRRLQFGVAFDPANIVAGGLDPVSYLHGLGAPDMVHLKDVEIHSGPRVPAGIGWKRYGPGPFVRFRGMGDGQVDWARLKSTLGTLNFTGPCVFEMEDPTISPLAGLARAISAAQNFLAGGWDSA